MLSYMASLRKRNGIRYWYACFTDINGRRKALKIAYDWETAYREPLTQARTGSLSNQFYSILVSAGLAPPRAHKALKNGRDGKRKGNSLSFHCLRHTATSLLKNAGVSEAVAMDIIGHDSKAVSANYTHIEVSAKRKAVNALPDISSF